MTRFSIENRFQCTLAEFERRLFDSGLQPRLLAAMPTLRAIEPLSREEDEREIRSRVRYTPEVGDRIPAFGRKLIRPSMLTWIEESTFDKARHVFHYRNLPNLPEAWRDLFDSHGSYSLTAEEGGVHRRIDGEIHVKVPLFGGRIERMLEREVTESFRSEAAALARWLAE